MRVCVRSFGAILLAAGLLVGCRSVKTDRELVKTIHGERAKPGERYAIVIVQDVAPGVPVVVGELRRSTEYEPITQEVYRVQENRRVEGPLRLLGKTLEIASLGMLTKEQNLSRRSRDLPMETVESPDPSGRTRLEVTGVPGQRLEVELMLRMAEAEDEDREMEWPFVTTDEDGRFAIDLTDLGRSVRGDLDLIESLEVLIWARAADAKLVHRVSQEALAVAYR